MYFLLPTLPEQVHIFGDGNTREVYVNNTLLDPKPSQKIRNHSPDGFNWGYSGSGPAQLALAILMKYLPAEDAQKYYQRFKQKVIAGLPQGDFDITVNLKMEIKELMEQVSA